MQVLKSLQDSVKQIEQMYADYEDLGLLIEMSQEEQDEETVQESRKNCSVLKESLKS